MDLINSLGVQTHVNRRLAQKSSSSVGNATQVGLNKIQGDLGEAAVIARIESSKSLSVVGTQLKVNTPGVGGHRNIDILVEHRSSRRFIIEVKTGGATRSTIQLAKDGDIADPLLDTFFSGPKAEKLNLGEATLRTFEINASKLTR